MSSIHAKRFASRGIFSSTSIRLSLPSLLRSAAANFSSTGVFLERFVAHARHVEVQVFGDGHGRTVSLGTRDCSLQRRNQKVVEEAPEAEVVETEAVEENPEAAEAAE